MPYSAGSGVDPTVEERLPEVDRTSTLTQEEVDRYRKTIANLQHLLQIEVRKTGKLAQMAQGDLFGGHPAPLEAYFKRCVDDARVEVFDRWQAQKEQAAASGAASKGANMSGFQGGDDAMSKSNATLRLKQTARSAKQVTTDAFTSHDKRRVVELLFSNQELMGVLERKLQELGGSVGA